MFDHPLPWALGLLVAIATATVAIFATRLRLLPEVIELSIIPTGASFGSLLGALYGAARRYQPDRIARLPRRDAVLRGLTTVACAIALLAEVVS